MLVNPKQYQISISCVLYNPVDAETTYWGSGPVAPVTLEGAHKIGIEHHCRLIAGFLAPGVLGGVTGTGESVSIYIRKNATTDFLFSSSVILTTILPTPTRKTDFNIPFVPGDWFEVKNIHPTWVTNPLGVFYILTLLFEE